MKETVQLVIDHVAQKPNKKPIRRWHLNGNRKISESLRKERENLIASGGQEKPRPVDDEYSCTIDDAHGSVKKPVARLRVNAFEISDALLRHADRSSSLWMTFGASARRCDDTNQTDLDINLPLQSQLTKLK
jgi:hypothetical protein